MDDSMMFASLGDEVLEQKAREEMASGAEAPALLVEFLVAGVGPTRAAIAVCVAAGSSRAEAERRFGPFDGIWELIEMGNEADVVDVLARMGYFEPDATLNEDQLEIVARLQLSAPLSGVFQAALRGACLST